MTIEMTAAQARALADFAADKGVVALHQVARGGESPSADVYVTPHGSNRGFRIDAAGKVSPIGETLPAAE
jgi:hypothetical protein